MHLNVAIYSLRWKCDFMSILHKRKFHFLNRPSLNSNPGYLWEYEPTCLIYQMKATNSSNKYSKEMGGCPFNAKHTFNTIHMAVMCRLTAH